MATAIAGGVAGATLLALFFVPAAFVLLLRMGMTCPLGEACPFAGEEQAADAPQVLQGAGAASR